MAQRGQVGSDTVKEPHSVSLKVLRLCRPSLSIQHPLPLPTPSPSPPSSSSSTLQTTPHVSASLAYPTSKQEPSPFILSPLLTLPPAFGSAYVGETFSCTLCANNEILLGSGGGTGGKRVSNVRIEAEMKIPSSKIPIPLVLGPEMPQSPMKGDSNSSPNEEDEERYHHGVDLESGRSLQKVVNFDLKEEGSHVLAVTVTYHESTATSGKVRTFRKLYQFVCKGCMVVRTKTGPLPSPSPSSRRWALEAQLENCGEETIVLDTVVLETRVGFRSTGLNWEGGGSGERDGSWGKPTLMPRDVQQVCFLVEEEEEGEVEVVDGRLVFGILSLGWRGTMGNRGFLSTGNLGTKVL